MTYKMIFKDEHGNFTANEISLDEVKDILVSMGVLNDKLIDELIERAKEKNKMEVELMSEDGSKTINFTLKKNVVDKDSDEVFAFDSLSKLQAELVDEVKDMEEKDLDDVLKEGEGVFIKLLADLNTESENLKKALGYDYKTTDIGAVKNSLCKMFHIGTRLNALKVCLTTGQVYLDKAKKSKKKGKKNEKK